MKRLFEPSSDVVELISGLLEKRGTDLKEARRLAASVQRLSDWFIAHPDGHTPWDEAWAVEAYLAYYLPLNELRVRAVVHEGLVTGFFTGLRNVVDFGAGPATASLALKASVPDLREFRLVERSSVPGRLLEQAGRREFKFQTRWSPDLIDSPKQTLFVASYSLTEGELPREALAAEALMLIEPSTQDDGRKLLERRQRLIADGFFIWAPCPHQSECPLLAESKRDWCHDRVHVERPPWLKAIEDHLPFRNQTVTFSYLLARKTAPVPVPWARLVGDRLEEKGKDRQMICRGSHREFLAWMHRQKNTQDLPRGVRVLLPSDLKAAGNELRVLETKVALARDE